MSKTIIKKVEEIVPHDSNCLIKLSGTCDCGRSDRIKKIFALFKKEVGTIIGKDGYCECTDTDEDGNMNWHCRCGIESKNELRREQRLALKEHLK